MAYDPTTALNNLLARKQQITTELAAMAAGTLPAVPNAQGAGSIDFVGYRKSLYDELRSIDELIAVMQGPFEVMQQGMT